MKGAYLSNIFMEEFGLDLYIHQHNLMIS